MSTQQDQEIPGLRLVRHNAQNVNLPEDPAYPYKLDLNFSPPDFMIVTFVSLPADPRSSSSKG